MINIIKMLLLLGGAKELAPTEETFNNPPVVSSLTYTQFIKEIIVNNTEETFNNPPVVSSLTYTQFIKEIIVNNTEETFNNPPVVSSISLTQIAS